jgi:tetratricopeptide (TPR) repeat protein
VPGEETRTLAPLSDTPSLRVVEPVMRPKPKLGLAAWLAIFVIGGGAIGVGLAVLAVKLRQPPVAAQEGEGEKPDAKPPGDDKPPDPPQKDPAEDREHALKALLATADRAVARNDDKVAVRALEQVLQLDPDNVQAHRTLGMVAWREKDYPTAKKHLDEAARLDERYQKQLAPILMILEKKTASATEPPEGG